MTSPGPPDGNHRSDADSPNHGAPPANAEDGLHLIVCSHGFMGWADNLANLVRTLQESVDSTNTVVFNSQANSVLSTFDGVDVCGDRLLVEIEDKLRELQHVRRFSIIGYSMGGLIARYAIGKMLEQGLFDTIQPMNYGHRIVIQNFITIATPHLGIVRPHGTLYSSVYNYMSSFIVSHAGEQMALSDDYLNGLPLLYVMGMPGTSFYAALELFRRRALYANAINDRTVPYCTASINAHNPYRKVDRARLKFQQKYPHIVEAIDQAAATAESSSEGASSAGRRVSELVEAAHGDDRADVALEEPADLEQEGMTTVLQVGGDPVAAAVEEAMDDAQGAAETMAHATRPPEQTPATNGSAPASNAWDSVSTTVRYSAMALAAIPVATVATVTAAVALTAINVQSRWRARGHRIERASSSAALSKSGLLAASVALPEDAASAIAHIQERDGAAAQETTTALSGMVATSPMEGPGQAIKPAAARTPDQLLAMRHAQLDALNRLGWEKYDAYLDGWVNTHGVIIHRPSGMYQLTGRQPVTDVLDHLAQHLARL